MKTPDINIKLVDGYFKLLENLAPKYKLELISKLSKSIKVDFNNSNSKFYNSFGAWNSDETAEELISELQSSRKFERLIEEL
ncbi:MAG: hypothetical protein Q8R57_12250 [Bacteroidota bacterium]|nr:hypothetical protein [Bacteroidota bacterium]